MLIPAQLNQFGLNEKEARIYLAVLGLGGGSVQEIARAANLHRVSTYDLLEALRNKGFVFESKRGARRVILPAEPEQLLEMLRGRERAFGTLLPELNALRAKERGRPRVGYFEGEADLVNSLTNFFEQIADNQEILIQGSIERLSTLLGRKLKTILSGAAENNQRIKFLIPQNSTRPHELDALKNLETKTALGGASADVLTVIAGERLLSLSFEQNTALLIEDRSEAKNREHLFNSLWQHL